MFNHLFIAMLMLPQCHHDMNKDICLSKNHVDRPGFWFACCSGETCGLCGLLIHRDEFKRQGSYFSKNISILIEFKDEHNILNKEYFNRFKTPYTNVAYQQVLRELYIVQITTRICLFDLLNYLKDNDKILTCQNSFLR